MNKFLFVVNPVSGGIDKQELIAQIKNFCRDQSLEFEVFYTTGDDDQAKLEKQIIRIRPDTLVISGGDGTINMAVPLLLSHELRLGVIPAGSANGLASEFGITKENAFETLIAPVIKALDIVQFNDHKYMLHLADFGLNAMLVKRYEEEDRRGLLGYAISAIKELAGLEKPFKVTIEANEKKYTYTTRFLVIANAKKYGTGFEVNPKCKHGNQQVELCVLREIEPQMVIEKLLAPTEPNGKNHLFEILSVKEASISCERPIVFQSDGEYLGEFQNLKVRVIDQSVKVITPA